MTNFPCPYCARQHDRAECPGCGAPASRIPDGYSVAALPGYGMFSGLMMAGTAPGYAGAISGMMSSRQHLQNGNILSAYSNGGTTRFYTNSGLQSSSALSAILGL